VIGSLVNAFLVCAFLAVCGATYLEEGGEPPAKVQELDPLVRVPQQRPKPRPRRASVRRIVHVSVREGSRRGYSSSRYRSSSRRVSGGGFSFGK